MVKERIVKPVKENIKNNIILSQLSQALCKI
jgi:hypothetical protein